MSHKDEIDHENTLRQHAQQILRGESINLDDLSFEELHRLLQEIQSQQVALRLKNDALQRANEVLARKEAQYRRLIAISPDSIVLTDLEGNIRMCNQRTAALHGYECPQDLIGVNAFELIAPEEWERARINLEKALAGEEIESVAYRMVKIDGSEFLAELNTALIRSAKGEPHAFIGVTRDITAREQAEEQLRFQAQLLDNVRESVMATDLEGHIVYWGKGAEKLYGYVAHEVMGKCITFIAVPEEEAEELARIEQVRKHGYWSGQYRQRRKDGSVFWADAIISLVRDEKGQARGLIGIDRDITAQKRAEQALQRYAKRLEIQHEIDRAVLLAESPDAIVQIALDYLRRLVPYTYASVAEIDLAAGRGHDLLVMDAAGDVLPSPPQYPLDRAGATLDVLKQGQVHVVQDICTLTAPSPLEQVLLEMGVRAYLNAPLLIQANLVGILNLSADQPHFFTPEYSEIAEEIADSLAAALHQARLYEQTQRDAQTKAMLLEEVNHRVGNNLTALMTILDFEKAQAAEGEMDCYAAFQDVRSRVESMATVHQMLSATAWVPLPLTDLVTQTVHAALSASPIQRHIEVTVTSPAEPLFVVSKQAFTLALILNELTTNSVKYAFQGRQQGHIQLGFAFVDTGQGQRQVRLAYQDDGPGWPDVVLEGHRYNVGMHLIRMSVEHTLGGELALHNNSGAMAVITFNPERY